MEENWAGTSATTYKGYKGEVILQFIPGHSA